MPKVPALDELQQRRSEKWFGYGDGVIAATVAEMDFELAEPIAAVLHDAVSRSDLGYTAGVPASLGEAFAGFARRRLDWQVDPDQLALVPDVMLGLIELCRIVAPGGSVGFASAAYPPFLLQLPPAGFSLVPIPLAADGSFDLDRLVAQLRDGLDVLILANPHNPTGRVLPREELEQIADLCAQYGAWVFADEIHAPLVLPGGAKHVPWLEVSDAARSCGISLTSASKAFNLAGLKAAMMVTASDRAQDVVRRSSIASEQAGLLGVLAAEVAFSQCDDWLDDVLRQLDRNRTVIDTGLPAGVSWTPPQATYVGWLDFAGALDEDPARFLLSKAGVALSPGTSYDPAATTFARLNFGTSEELVTEMLNRIATGLG
ncbi:MalY/PatB family protein [Kribbella monticola]|uniref:MalY/PatB family protein n=1 Tax=Kribbella monticola TaxID=2185285 RepID=UPI000DD47A1C|nr:aminotransferase class I/II-fold pyridoxal phosphate-dependent enzyme [Kribbella monticola]